MERLTVILLGIALMVAAPGVGASAGASAGDVRMPRHETLRIESGVMGETRRINVYLPPEYDQPPARRYPVLYMPDGGVQEDFPHVAAAVDRLVRAGQVAPMLVVGIENTQRRRDMTGPSDVASDREIAPVVGGSAAFRQFIATELMPVIRARYRVNGEDAVIGESLAGLFIVETLFEQASLFDTYIALDPSLWWNNEQWVRDAPGRLSAWPGTDDSRVRLYLASGDAERSNARQAERLTAALRGHAPARLQWHYEHRPELAHDTIYRGLEDTVLRALFPARLTGDGQASTGQASTGQDEGTPHPSAFDPDLARRLGADERGMRSYVLVILKSGPTPVTDAERRKAMFAGHFANMEQLVKEGRLVLAGPFSNDPAGWRGLFLLAVDDLEQARQLTETDPVIINGEMVAEYHRWYGSAGAMMLPELHERLTPGSP